MREAEPFGLPVAQPAPLSEGDQAARAVWLGLSDTTNQCPSVFDYHPDGGMRIFACHLRTHLSLQRLGELFGKPIFRSGPHTAVEIAYTDGSFGAYDPAFVQWMSDTFVPGAADTALRERTQPLYDTFAQPLARTFELVHRKLYAPQTAACMQSEKALYQQAMSEGVTGYYERWFGFLAPGFCAQSTPAEGFVDWEDFEVNENGNVVKSVVGFWLRRSMDGTDELWHAALLKLLGAYDSDWLAELQRGGR